MLENLNSINWKSLKHAFGSAEDVPIYILDLLSSDKKIREGAIEILGHSIYHQGTIYQATGYTIPFLFFY